MSLSIAGFNEGTLASEGYIPRLLERERAMRYFFNVYDGCSDPDHEGSDFSDWSAARLAAVTLAGEIFRDNPQRILSCPDWRIEVTNDAGFVLIRLDFCAVESPAATHLASI